MSTVREIAERTTEDFESWWKSDGRFIDPDTSDVDWFDKRKELAALAFIAARKPAPLSETGQLAIGKSIERLAHVLASTEPLGEVAPSEQYWDQHAVHCGNCSVEILTRGGPFKPGGKVSSGLSDTGDSEDEALCGMCAGAEMYRLDDRLNELQPEFSLMRDSIADLRAQLQAATMRAEAAEGDTRMMDELQAKCGALLMEVAAAKKERAEWNSELEQKHLELSNSFVKVNQENRRLQKLADERRRKASVAQYERDLAMVGLRAALETVGEELSVMYGRYEPTGSPSEDYAQMSEGLRIAREALAATLPAESAGQEADRLMSVIKRQQDRVDRQSAALRGMNEQVVSGLAKNQSLQRSMKNVFMLAKRELSRTKPREASKSKEIWGHLHRLCIEAGCESSILRNATPGGQPDTEVVVPFDEDEPCMCKRCEADRASSTTPAATPPAQEHPEAVCKRCNGKRTIQKHDGGMHFETDSRAEFNDHFFTISCPDCTAPEAQR